MADSLGGGPLFTRTSRRVELTAAGVLLREEAGRTLELAAHAKETVQRALRGETGRVRVAFAGNAVECRTLEEMLIGLAAPAGAMVIMDRGIATAANLVWLVEHGYRYLVVSRERERRFDADRAMTLLSAGEEPIQVVRELSADGQEVRLHCHSPGREMKETGIMERFCTRFEAGLTKLANGLTTPRGEKRPDRIQERIGRLKAASRGAGQHYTVTPEIDATGKTVTALRWEKTPVPGTMLTDPGVYCLRSNELSWDAEQLWRTYMMLTDLEAVFRSLKGELGLRPIFHSKEERSDGHLFISVLAYQFVQAILCLVEQLVLTASLTVTVHLLLTTKLLAKPSSG